MNTAGISKYASVETERTSCLGLLNLMPDKSLHPWGQEEAFCTLLSDKTFDFGILVCECKLFLACPTPTFKPHKVYSIQAEFLGCFTISTQACFPSINPLGIAFGVKISYLKMRKHQTSHTSVFEKKNKTKEISIHSYVIVRSTVFQKTLHL